MIQTGVEKLKPLLCVPSEEAGSAVDSMRPTRRCRNRAPVPLTDEEIVVPYTWICTEDTASHPCYFFPSISSHPRRVMVQIPAWDKSSPPVFASPPATAVSVGPEAFDGVAP